MGVAQAEVDYLEPPAVARRLQQQVLWLQVPVRHVVLVQVVDTIHLLGRAVRHSTSFKGKACCGLLVSSSKG